MATRGRWPPYILWPSAREMGRAEATVVEATATTAGDDWFRAVEAGQVDIVCEWPVEIVLKNLLAPIAAMLTRSEDLKSVDDVDLSGWTAITRRIARELPYGGTLRQEMNAIADRVEGMRQHFTRHLDPNYRVRGMKTELSLRLNLLVYATDRLLRTVQEQEPAYARMRASERGTATYLSYDFAGVWERWLGPLGAPASATSDDAMRERVARIRRKVLPGHEDAIVRDVLADVLTYGSFLPDGTLRHPETVSTSKNG